MTILTAGGRIDGSATRSASDTSPRAPKAQVAEAILDAVERLRAQPLN